MRFFGLSLGFAANLLLFVGSSHAMCLVAANGPYATKQFKNSCSHAVTVSYCGAKTKSSGVVNIQAGAIQATPATNDEGVNWIECKTDDYISGSCTFRRNPCN